jgi:hypothetical protein
MMPTDDMQTDDLRWPGLMKPNWIEAIRTKAPATPRSLHVSMGTGSLSVKN